MKKLLLFIALTTVFSSFAAIDEKNLTEDELFQLSEDEVEVIFEQIKYPLFRLPANIDKINFYYHDNEYHIIYDEVDNHVQNAFVDKELWNLTQEQFEKFFQNGGYLDIKQSEEGQFFIHAKQRVLGGGLFGLKVGFWTGKILTHALAQGGILLVTAGATIICPASGPLVYGALNNATFVYVEATSNAIALAGAITGSVMTGPV